MTRKEALKIMSIAAACLMGKRAPAQTQNTYDSTGSGVFMSAGITFHPKFTLPLDDFGGFEIDRGGDKISFSADQIWAALKTVDAYACPVDGSKGQLLGSVAIGMDGQDGIGDAFAAQAGWVPGLALHRCNECGLLYATERKKH